MSETGGQMAPRPRVVGAASVLWIILGVFLALGGLTVAMLSPVVTVILVVLGVVVWWNGLRLRRGRDVRVVLVVVGVVTCIGIWPVLLVAPAIVLQYHPNSRHWFSLPHADPPRPS
jgi:xanthine/uracil permease